MGHWEEELHIFFGGGVYKETSKIIHFSKSYQGILNKVLGLGILLACIRHGERGKPCMSVS